MKQNLTKKQHYVPRMYLKHWQRENDQKLQVITKKSQDNTVKSVTVDDELFYQEYCYDILNPNGIPLTSNEVEKTFGEYENRHSRLLDRILDRCRRDVPVLDKGTNRIEDFLEFVALMIVRNPNNVIQFCFDGILTSTSQLDNLFHTMFGDKWKITALQVVANSIAKKHLFEIVKSVNETDNPKKIYFVKSADHTHFITSDNPVLCHNQWSYIPLSPHYAAVILCDIRLNCRFNPNRVFQLSNEEVQRINGLYWKQSNVFTIVLSP